MIVLLKIRLKSCRSVKFLISKYKATNNKGPLYIEGVRKVSSYINKK